MNTLLAEHLQVERKLLLSQIARDIEEQDRKLLLSIQEHLAALELLPSQPGSMPVALETEHAETEAEERALDRGMSSMQAQPDALQINRRRSKTLRKEKIPDSPLGRFVHSPSFEVASGAFILVNALITGLQVEYSGQDLGYQIGYPFFEKSGENYYPYAADCFAFLDVFFTMIFILELVLRVVSDPTRAWKSRWIWLDFFLVSSDILNATGVTTGNLDPKVMRTVRLFRMVRVLKIVRTVNSFDALYVLIRSLQASLSALVWSFAVLLLIQVAVGIVLSQLLHDFIASDAPEDARARTFGYFGTFGRTIITMFEIALGNWVPTCRFLTDNVNPWFMIFYLLYRCCFFFAVVRVITAVFITETNRAVASDDELAIRKKKRSQDQYTAKVKEIFEELDTSGDGKISHEEFKRITEDGLLTDWSSLLGIDTTDVARLFKLLDNGDGEIDMQEFLAGLKHMNTDTKKFDIASLSQMLDVLTFKVDLLIARNSAVPAGSKQLADATSARARISTKWLPEGAGFVKSPHSASAPVWLKECEEAAFVPPDSSAGALSASSTPMMSPREETAVVQCI